MKDLENMILEQTYEKEKYFECIDVNEGTSSLEQTSPSPYQDFEPLSRALVRPENLSRPRAINSDGARIGFH